jgi:hypothetical protein
MASSLPAPAVAARPTAAQDSAHVRPGFRERIAVGEVGDDIHLLGRGIAGGRLRLSDSVTIA